MATTPPNTRFGHRDSGETRQLRRLQALQTGLGNSIHFARKVAIPTLRHRVDHSTLISSATYSPWKTDIIFQNLRAVVHDSTLLDEMRLYELWRLAGQASARGGDAIEVGCWRGGAGSLVATQFANAGQKVFLCDTFRGVVKASSRDNSYRGDEHHDADPDDVRHLADRLNLHNVEILSGVFPDETGDAVRGRYFGFAHLDLDVYEGTRAALTFLIPFLLPGAIVVFDDYGATKTDGVRQFVDEFEEQGDFAVIHNLNGQAVAVRVISGA